MKKLKYEIVLLTEREQNQTDAFLATITRSASSLGRLEKETHDRPHTIPAISLQAKPNSIPAIKNATLPPQHHDSAQSHELDFNGYPLPSPPPPPTS